MQFVMSGVPDMISHNTALCRCGGGRKVAPNAGAPLLSLQPHERHHQHNTVPCGLTSSRVHRHVWLCRFSDEFHSYNKNDPDSDDVLSIAFRNSRSLQELSGFACSHTAGV